MAICGEIPYVVRQLIDTIKLAPAEFVAYMVTTIWRGIYSAINLYWLSVLCDRVCRSCRLRKWWILYSQQLGGGFIGRALPQWVYWPLAVSWVSCALVNVAAERALQVFQDDYMRIR